MKKKLSLLLLFSILFFAHKSVIGQSAPYCPSINAQFGTGPSTTICQGNCATLASSVVPVNQTTTYSVGSTPYAPFSFTSGTSILANQDDIWSAVLNLGFPFCYFGNTYNQCIVGSNGQVSFNLATASGYDNWSITTAMPNTTDMPGNTICAAFRDIDPTSSGNIYYAYYGTAPCRSMVISWNNIPLYSGSCYPSDPASTFQLVLHETTNYIDVFIQNSTSCSAWNGGYGIIGIQNAAASIGVSPAGRNYPSTWTAVNEGWRFVPTGPQSYTVNWNGPSGLVGTGLSVAVCPSVTTSYTANMVVSPCSSSSTTFSSVVQVSVVPGPTLVTNSPTICGGGSATLTVSGATSYTWLPSNSTATSIVVSPSSTTTYTVIGKTGTSCSVTKTVQVTVSPTPTVTPGSNSPICAGSTLSLTTNAASSYTWTGPNSFSSNLQNPTIPSASTLAAGQYTVKVTSVGGCTATAVINVVVNNAPGVTASNSGPICPNQTLSLTSVGSGPYSWTGPNAFSSTLQNPTIPSASTLAAGVYSVVAGVGTCTALATTTVVINALPTPTASNTGPYCSGATIQLNVGAFSTYTWSGPAFSSNSQNPTIPNSTTAMSGTYTVTVTSASGCTASATTSVTVNPLPVPVVGSNSPLCAGQTLSLTSSGGNTYSWSGPNSFSSTLQNPTIPSVTSANAGVYTVTVTSAAGCVKTGTISITVNTPTSTAANTGPYCAGQTISLSTPAATSYTWSGPSAFSSNAQNPTIPNSTTAMSGVYTVTSTTGGCSSTATTNVIVNALPTPTASNTGPYCPGATIQLNVGAFSTYTWSGPSSFSSNSQNPTQVNAQTTNGGMYTVSVTNAQGCMNTATTNVVINPLPVPVVGSNSPLCAGNTLSLTATGGSTYAWSGPNSFSSALQNPTIPSVTSSNAGVYTVTVTSLAGCVNTGTVSVTVNTPTTTAANTGPYCVGQTISLSSPSATSYTWSGPSAFSSNAQNPTILNSTTAMSGVYTVTSTTGSCSSTATTNVIVNALPIPTASNTGPYCPGATIQLNVGSFTTYTWSGPSSFSSNSQNPTQVNAQTTNGGVYTVSVTNAQGCMNTATTNVVINPLPVPVVGSNSPLCAGTTLSLTAAGGSTYAWSGPNSFSSALQNPTVPSVTTANAGVYTVTVTSAAGCVNTGTVNITVNTPTSTAANTGPYCVGQTISLNTPAATSFTWSGPSFSSNAQNPTIPNSTTAMSGVYTVTANTGGCTSTATTNVIVNALPVPTAGNTGPYCPGNTIQLNVGAFTTYTWSGPSSFSSNSQNPTQANAQTTNGGVYTVSVTNAQGCVNTTTTNVVVNPTPVVNVGSNSPVCLNTNINLTSNGGTSYSWSGPNSFSSTLQNPTVVNATLADAGVYTVTVTALGCTNTGTVNVIVTSPTTSAANSGPYCAGSTISLSAPPATSYTWSGPGGYSSNAQNATQVNATPAMSGTYSVIVSIGTCTANATTNVVVNALPTPTAQNNSPVCAGQTINFTGLGGTTYTWSGPSYNSTQQNPFITNANASNAGTYTLTVTDANGCTNIATTNVIVNPLPVIAVNNPTNCVNTTINLTSNGGTSYSWIGPNSFSSTAQNPNIPSAQLNMSGVYVVTVTDVNGCVNTASANVSVLPLPNPNIAGNSPVCVGGTLNLQGSGGAVYAWSGPGYTGPNQNPTINNVNASAAGVYTLLVSSGSCTASTTYTVVINPLPVFNFTNNNVLCNGQSNGSSNVNVTVGTSPYNYLWSTSPVQTTSTANNLTAGTYTCFVTDANGCSNIASTQIAQPTVFTITANSSVNSACAGVPINANANGNGGTAPYNFNWVGGPASSSYAINETISGNYIYTVNATDANGCVAVANLNLTFFPQPTVTATSATLCVGQSTVLTAQGANSYTWQPGNVTGSTYPFNGNTTTNITVTGSANGCNNTYNTAIMVNPNPNGGINISSNKGCVPTCIDFNSNGSQNVVSYNWILNGAGITGSVNGSYCFNEAASYTIGLTVMDAFGCTGTANPVVVDIYPQPTADFNYSPIKPIVNIDQDVIFTDASYGTTITNWNWYFMNTAQYTSVLQNPTFAYTEPGTYAVALVVKSDKGCTDTLVKQIVVGEDFGIYVPNAFTPNGDGLNDIFQPKGFGVTKYEINIFDRWGERVFHTNAFDEGWDGTIKGRTNKPVEDGVYTWLINCTDVFGKSHELKGHVTLMK